MHMFGYGILVGGYWGDDYACLSGNELAHVWYVYVVCVWADYAICGLVHIVH